MPSKSAKFSSGARSSAFAAAIFTAFLQTAPAGAALTVIPLRDSGQRLDNVSGSSIYYPVGLTAPAFLDNDTGSDLANVSATLAVPLDTTRGLSTGDTTTNNAMYFLVSSDHALTLTAGTRAAVIVTAAGQGSSGGKPVPIAFISGATSQTGFCGSTNCFGRGTFNITGTNPQLYAAGDIPNLSSTPPAAGAAVTSVVIGIYPHDICYGFRNTASSTGTLAAGCDNTDNPIANGTALTLPAAMQLTFGFYSVPLNNTPPGTDTLPVSTATALDTAVNLQLYFTSLSPSFSCPNSPRFPDNLYTPGDGQITVTSDVFGGSLVPGANPSPGPSPTPVVTPYLPPISKLIVVGTPAPSAPDLTASYASSGTNKIGPAKVSIGVNTLPITGFTNSDSLADLHPYTLGFMIRDKAGIVATAAGCTQPNVVTSTIQGFLRQGNCFVATAAFRSVDAAPVELLRQFRTRILMRFPLGRAFVRAYYASSPPAAEWLMEHPEFRAPVLLLLAPIEAIAWLLLHPLLFGAVLVLNLLAASALLFGRRSQTVRAPGASAGVRT